MNTKKTYIDTDGNVRPYPAIGEGPAELATPEDIERDDLGFTNPNLHRRVDPKPEGRLLGEDVEYTNREYKFTIGHLNSYRTTTINTHNEAADKITDVNVEIP